MQKQPAIDPAAAAAVTVACLQVLRSAGAVMHFNLHLAAQEGLVDVVREELRCR
jgi:hypothetical protein